MILEECKLHIYENETCPCGSGESYKSCCMNRKDTWSEEKAKESLLNPKRMEYEISKMIQDSRSKLCLYPNDKECAGIIKNAHTIQNKRILEKLVNDGHVYTMQLNSVNQFTGPQFKFEKVSRNKATTFTGFCEYHDSNVFRSIETTKYLDTEEQNFLFAYRAFSQEYWKKLMSQKNLQNTFRNKPSLLKNVSMVQNYRLQSLSWSEMREIKQIFDDIIKNEKYSSICTLRRELPQCYDFAFVCTYNPEYDLLKNVLNDVFSHQKERMKPIFMTVIPIENKQNILISFLEEDSDFFTAFLQQIKYLNDTDFRKFINNVAAICTENLVISKRLYDKWNESEIRGETMMQAYEKRFIKYLTHCGSEANFLKTTKYNLFIEFTC